MKNYIYFDHAATTPMRDEVIEAMRPFYQERFGNPSSIYQLGRSGKESLEQSRQKIAEILGAQPAEIFFTASGTEADNWAIKGLASARKNLGKHLIISAIEHHAVLHSAQALTAWGFEISYLPVNTDGLVEIKALEKLIRPDTILISVMMANNEIGSIQAIAELSKLAKSKNIPFHSDGVQAVAKLAINLEELGVDLFSFSAHKFAGPKGVGALYIRQGTEIRPFLDGGAQERDKRASTENVAGIAGMAKALELAEAERVGEFKRLKVLRDFTWKEIQKIAPEARLNGSLEQRLPNNLNIAFPGLSAELMLLALDQEGVCLSSGSACSAGSLDPSHVLLALGLNKDLASSSLRLTFGRGNTQLEVEKFLRIFDKILQKQRQKTGFKQ